MEIILSTTIDDCVEPRRIEGCCCSEAKGKKIKKKLKKKPVVIVERKAKAEPEAVTEYKTLLERNAWLENELNVYKINLENVQKDLERKTQLLVEAESRIQQLKKDFENLKSRLENELAEAQSRGAEKLVKKLLEVADNFDRAIKLSKTDNDASSIIEGLKSIHSQFFTILKSEGVEPIEPAGAKFDPNIHYAVECTNVTDESADNIIVEVLQKGYLYKNKVIRPAMVRVSKYTPPPPTMTKKVKKKLVVVAKKKK